MTAWHEEARFDVFCECDVFIEDGHYLYVENQPFDYNGNYICCDYQQGRNADNTMFYMKGEHSGASNDYIMSLRKAPWKVARDVIEKELKDMERIEAELDNDRDEDDRNAPIIEDARRCLMEYATENEVFSYC